MQSGVVAWEDREPVPDWHWKTVTVCAADLSILGALLAQIVALRQPSHTFFRFYTSALRADRGAVQTRKLLSVLRQDPPGFSNTFAEIVEGRACVVSELTAPHDLDVGYLTAYREVGLLETGESNLKSSEQLSRALPGVVSDLGGEGIARLLAHPALTSVLRLLDRETHAAMQIMCSGETSTRIVEMLAQRNIRRVHDARTLPAEISRLS